MNDVPRRNRVDRWSLAERAINDAMLEVEKAGAHPLLTDAVILLGQAREKVADFVDRTDLPSPEISGGTKASTDSDLICTVCGRKSGTDFAHSLRNGWEKCCGYTMRLVTTRANIEGAVVDAIGPQIKLERLATPSETEAPR